MALYHQGKLYTCSTAAGPALEGACIHMGMAAAPGAIDKVTLGKNGELLWHTIGDQPAKGICGSGLISLIACLVEDMAFRDLSPTFSVWLGCFLEHR